MNNGLLAILSVIGLFALYWALIGQWKHNKMMRKSQAEETKEAKGTDTMKDVNKIGKVLNHDNNK